jgi:MFS family permease
MMWFTIIISGMIAGAYVLYALNYFELEPQYLCQFGLSAAWEKCVQKQVCEPTKNSITNFKIDFDTNLSLHNWVEQYKIGCISEFAKSMLGSTFFIGAFIGSFIIPPMADVRGRKPMFLLGLAVYFVVLIGLRFGSNLETLYSMIFLGGICETGRYYVAYVYIVEIFPKRL